MKNQPCILVVEDQVGYAELIREAIKHSFPEVKIRVVPSAEKAWFFLKQYLPTATEPVIYPSLTILDLNLPKMSGLELLSLIKQDDDLQAIPVIVFSTSQAEEDILQCYQAQANCYITKPKDVDEFFNVVQKIVNFWLKTVSLPHTSPV